jgi:hypothetical protein
MPQGNKKKSSWKIVLRALPYLKPHRLWVGLTVFCAALFALDTIGTSYLYEGPHRCRRGRAAG